MGVIVRQSVKNAIVTYSGLAIGFVLTIFLYPRILAANQYGLTRVLLAIATVSTQFADLGMQNTIIRYFPYFRDEKNNHHGFLFLSLTVPLVGMIILALGLMVFRPLIIPYFTDSSQLLVNYYWLLIPLSFFILFFQVLTSFIQALYDIVMSTFLDSIVIRLLTILILLLYLFEWITFTEFIIYFVFSYGVILLALFVYLFSTTSLTLKPDFSFLNTGLLKKMLNYSIYAFFGEVATVLVSRIDILMLGAMAGLDDTGIYAIAFYVGSAVMIMARSINRISAPLIADAFKKEDYETINDIYRRSALNEWIGGGLLFCGVIANLDNLMTLLPPEYSGGAPVIIIIGGTYLLSMTTGINGGIIVNSKYYRFDLWSTLFFIALAVILNYLLIPLYGILGAALATGGSFLIYNFIKVIFVWIRFKMQPFRWPMLTILLIGALTLLLVFQIPLIGNVYVDIVLRSLLVTGLYLLPILALNISENLNQIAREGLQRVREYIG